MLRSAIIRWLSLLTILLLPNQLRANCPAGDLNNDWVVNLLDLRVLAEQWLAWGTSADIDGNGQIGMSDFGLLAINWRTKATGLVINEFMAVNNSEPPLSNGELLDEDGTSSDWIEIYNATPLAVNAEGWYLTDDADNLTKWEFPALEIAPYGFLVLFASGKDRVDPESELHTNFKISGKAGFLAIVMPDGRTIAHAYKYPGQFSDISYGLAQDTIGTIDLLSARQGFFFSPTPGKANGPIVADLGPAIRDVTENPTPPAPGEVLVITAEVKETLNPISEVRLVCRVNFESANRWLPSNGLRMLDDGMGPDAVANDGIFTVAIPPIAYGPGNMVRWRVIATDTEGVATREPRFLFPTDSPEYFGTVVRDPSIQTELALIQWFVENVAASETDSGARGAVYFLGEFYDNVVIHRRGGSTADMPKRHFKFRFNHGYKFKYDGGFPRVNEFNLNSTFSDKAYLRQNLAFEAYDWCGCPGSISFPMCAYRNGQFYGVQVFIEEPEEELLEREGFDPDGALYKMYNTFSAGGSAEKKTRRWEGRTDLDNFCKSINNTSGAARHNNIFDQVNLPLTLNYLAATVLVHQNDHPHKNHYLYRDSDGSGEWFFLPWDHDLTWGSNWTGSSFHDYIYADDDQVPGKPTDVKPSHPFIGKEDCKEWNFHWNRLIDALLNDPIVRGMFNRRLRTVMDEFIKPPGTPYSGLFIENRIDELVAQMAPDVARDYAKWANPWPWGGQGGYPVDQSFQYAINVIKNDYLAPRRYHLFVRHNVNNMAAYDIPGSYSASLPNSQPADIVIKFGSYDYNPASGNQDEEYVELINPNNYAVDISSWQLTGGIQHTFLPGTVIVSGGSLYVSPNVAAFRKRASSPSRGEGRFVQGNYKGHLSSWGETVNLLNKQGVLVGSMSYPGSPSDQQRFLRITEIMYNPAAGGTFGNEEYEYIELKNVGTATLSLQGAKFTDGILFGRLN